MLRKHKTILCFILLLICISGFTAIWFLTNNGDGYYNFRLKSYERNPIEVKIFNITNNNTVFDDVLIYEQIVDVRLIEGVYSVYICWELNNIYQFFDLYRIVKLNEDVLLTIDLMEG